MPNSAQAAQPLIKLRWALRRSLGARAVQAQDNFLVFFLDRDKRIVGRVTASAMAAASAASFLPRLPPMRYGVTNFCAISLTVWPC